MMRTIVLLVWLTLPFASTDAKPDLGGKSVEDFDWNGYVEEGQSTAGQLRRAQEGGRQLERRMNELVNDYRERLKKREEAEAIKWFNIAQGAWETAMSAELEMVRLGWPEGSGAKVAVPKARMRVIQQRILSLRRLGSDCLLLNQ